MNSCFWLSWFPTHSPEKSEWMGHGKVLLQSVRDLVPGASCIKAQSRLKNVPPGLNRLRKNSMERESFVNARAAGAEAPTILMDLCGPAKAVPLLQGPPHGVFPQPLKPLVHFGPLPARVNSRPDTNHLAVFDGRGSGGPHYSQSGDRRQGVPFDPADASN